MTDVDWPSDPGLAGERTAMAWVRTALSIFGVSALVARQSGSLPLAAVVLVLTLGAAAWLIVDAERRHTVGGGDAPGPVAAPGPVLLATTLSLLLTAIALLLVLA